MAVVTLTVKASTLSEEVRDKMGLDPGAMVDIRPHLPEKKGNKTKEEIARMQKLVDSIRPATGADNTDAVTVLRSLRDGREGRSSSTEDDNV